MSKTPTPSPAPAPVVDQLPQTGGSYTRQPDGSLLRTDDAPAPAAQPTTDTPE